MILCRVIMTFSAREISFIVSIRLNRTAKIVNGFETAERSLLSKSLFVLMDIFRIILSRTNRETLVTNIIATKTANALRYSFAI